MGHAGVTCKAAEAAGIAARLGLPTGTGTSRVHHGRRLARPLLRGDG
jgi:hypothetical protein